jgi:hypothetical protein
MHAAGQLAAQVDGQPVAADRAIAVAHHINLFRGQRLPGALDQGAHILGMQRA